MKRFTILAALLCCCCSATLAQQMNRYGPGGTAPPADQSGAYGSALPPPAAPAASPRTSAGGGSTATFGNNGANVANSTAPTDNRAEAAPGGTGTVDSAGTGAQTGSGAGVPVTPATGQAPDASFRTTETRTTRETSEVQTPTPEPATPLATPTPGTAPPVALQATPQPTPQPTYRPQPIPTATRAATATPAALAAPLLPPSPRTRMSPLWKVGTFLLTLLGLAALVAFAPEFADVPRQHLVLAGICGGLGALSLGIDSLAGASPAASPAQSLLSLCGFGGLMMSGVLDRHRNRIAAGAVWLAAAALLTHSISQASQGAVSLSGGLAVLSSFCAVGLCALSFLPETATDATDEAGDDVDLAPVAATAGAAVAPAGAKVAPRPAKPTATKNGAGGVARLIAVEGLLKGQVYALRSGANSVGRDTAALQGNKITLSGDAAVSRIHAVLMCDNGRCVLSDTGAENGIVLNGGRVLDDRDLMNGDRVQIGATTFLYQRT